MDKQFATYEISKKLKELGFNEECLGLYWHTSNKPHNGTFALAFNVLKDTQKYCIAAPLWQQVIDFLWNKYHIVITRNPESVYDFNSWILRNDDNTYTLKQAILKAIEIITQNKTK